jgi:hypothetical protein
MGSYMDCGPGCDAFCSYKMVTDVSEKHVLSFYKVRFTIKLITQVTCISIS